VEDALRESQALVLDFRTGLHGVGGKGVPAVLFVQEAEQSDDITTLVIAYEGKHIDGPRTNT
jgi:hypothetical protein